MTKEARLRFGAARPGDLRLREAVVNHRASKFLTIVLLNFFSRLNTID
jgi:hypothetical protein